MAYYYKDKSSIVHFRLTTEDAEYLYSIAKENNTTISEYIRVLLAIDREYHERDNKHADKKIGKHD